MYGKDYIAISPLRGLSRSSAFGRQIKKLYVL